MSKKELPSPELLRQLLRYEPDTGKLYWRERTPDVFEDGRCKSFNSQFANKEAFTFTGRDGYKHGNVLNQRPYLAHRVIWAITYGEWPLNHIDHINGIRDDNRIENLRDVSRSENQKNQKRPAHNTSGAVGVSWANREKKWHAYINIDRRRESLGYFTDLAEAIAARKEAEAKYSFHPNHGRR